MFSLLLLQVKFLSEDQRTILQIFYIFRIEKVTQSILAAAQKVLSTPSRMEDSCFVDGCSHLTYVLHLGKAITANASHRC